MSLSLRPAETRRELLDQFESITDPHETSQQAVGDHGGNRHVDGDHIHKEIGVGDDAGMEPFYKYLARCERKGKTLARYPGAGLAPLLHVTEREVDVLRQIQTEWEPSDAHPTHEVLREESRRLRGKVLEWVAADDGDRLPGNASASKTVETLTDKGTDIQIHGEPGGGKSTLALWIAVTLMQLNNETVLWADTLDDEGATNERAEWLALAPWATLALPASHDVDARLAPEYHGLADVHLDLEDVARDVLRYDGPGDLVRQLEPGQFYVVYPDPLHRGCSDASRFRYWTPDAVTPPDEEGPNQATPADQWWFAFWAARISRDEFLHPTTVILDEGGNVLDEDARKDAHDTYQKCKWFRDKFADARKKGLSFVTMTHSLSELFPKFRQKQRWFFTPGGTSAPVGRTLPGGKECPLPSDFMHHYGAGEGVLWKADGTYAPMSWPNIKGKYQLDAELSLEFSPRRGSR